MTHVPVNDLAAISEELLTEARASSSGRAARTLLGERGQALHQTLVALLAGQGMAEHVNPGQASVQVLIGALTLRYGQESLTGGVGTLLRVPAQDHSVLADQDTVMLLTVAKSPGPDRP